MKPLYTIVKRELRSYFASPLAYIILVVFQVISARFFFLYLQGFLQFQFDPNYQLQTGELNLNKHRPSAYRTPYNHETPSR